MRFVCLLILLTLVAQIALADSVAVGCDIVLNERGRLDRYDYGTQLNARLIFFTCSYDDTDDLLLDEDTYMDTVDKIRWWIEENSNGSFVCSDDFGILFHPDDDFSGGTSGVGLAEPWRADLLSSWYRNPSLMDNEMREWYECRWGLQESGCEPGTLVADIADWWGGAQISTASLYSELLYKIYDEYLQLPHDQWPFGEFTGDPGEDDAVDVLFFVFLDGRNGSIYGEGIGGGTGIGVDTNAVVAFGDGLGLDFFGNLGLTENERFNATTMGSHLHHGPTAAEHHARTTLHEWGHTMGWNDGPPNLLDMESNDPTRYYYGNLNIMCQHYVPGKGIPVLSLAHLGTTGWIEVENFTGQNLDAQKIYDIRYDDDQPALPKIYRYDVNETYQFEEYFLFAYHAGTGVDAQESESGEKLIPGRGMEIEHVVTLASDDRWFVIIDIESAFGKYNMIHYDIMPDHEDSPFFPNWTLPPPPVLWYGAADPAEGFDNYDLWRIDGNISNLRRLVDPSDPNIGDGYTTYVGGVFDFYTFEQIDDGNGSQFRRTEFSFRDDPEVNPTSHGYNSYSVRYGEQSMPSSLSVKVIGQVSNPGPSDGPHLFVDFWSAPEEDILSPNGGELFVIGDPATIEWEHTYDEITTAVIKFSPDGGVTYPRELDIATVNASDSQYEWTPSVEYLSNEAVIKIVYSNSATTHTGDDTSDSPFAVVSNSTMKYVNVSPQTGIQYDGTPYSSVGLDYANDAAAINDLFITNNNQYATLFEGVSISLSGVPVFSLEPNALPSAPLPGHRGTSYADYNNDGQVDLFVAGGSVGYARLYENNGDGTFSDVSWVLQGPWTDVMAGVWADYDGDGWVDLFLCRGNTSGSGYVEDVLLKNKLGVSGYLNFVNQTTAERIDLNGANQTNSPAAVWLDVGNDGLMDLLVAESQSGAGNHAKLYVRVGPPTNRYNEESAIWFGDLASGMTGMTSVDAAYVDGDEYIDIVAGYDDQGSGAVVYLSGGDATYEQADAIDLAVVGGTSSVRFVDQDLDGRMDVMVTPASASDGPRFFRNYDPSMGGAAFYDNTSHVLGPQSAGVVGGLITLDWNRDGDQDLFLGRPTTGGDFFYRAERNDGTDEPAANTIVLQLQSPNGVNNGLGIGAKVEVDFSGSTLAQWVDGGSGRGGQRDVALTFPVDQSSGTVPVTVTWPNGWIQSTDVPVQTTPGTAPAVIVDDTNPTVVVSTVKASTQYYPVTGVFEWVFTWETEHGFDPDLDKVSIGDVAFGCGPVPAELTPATPGVTHTYMRLNTGRWKHTIRWGGWDCVGGCTIPFSVTSGHTSSITSTSPEAALVVRTCPTQL